MNKPCKLIEVLMNPDTVNETLPKTYVLGGEVKISTKKEILWTVLGSCISIIFYLSDRKITFFSHAQLPEREFRGTGCSSTCTKPCHKDNYANNENRFVSCSISNMVTGLKKIGYRKEHLKVYLIGGASAFNITFSGNKNVSERNIDVAKVFLKPLGVKIYTRVGGSKSRKILFNTDTGVLTLNEF